MPAIRPRRETRRPTGSRPGTSRHIACLPNKQPPPPRRSGSRHAMRVAGEDSAAQMERDGVRILKDCPCVCKSVGEEAGNLIGTRWLRSIGGGFPEVPLALPSPRQHFASATTAKL